MPPGTRIGPGQALHTTFASRIKAGVSTLIQPLPQQGDFSDPVYGRGGHQELAALPGSTRSGRMTKTMRYYEDESEIDEESSDDGAAATDGPRGRTSTTQQSQAAAAAAAGSSSRGTPMTNDQVQEPPGIRLGKPPPGNRIIVKKAQRTPHVYFSEDDSARAADHREALIPIKIEIELDSGHRVKDSFVWNINERLYTPDHFVRVFLQDLDLPYEPYGHQIEASIHQQIEEWTTLAEIDVSPAPGGIWACRNPDASKGERRRADIPDTRERNKDARTWDWGIRQEYKRHMKGAQADVTAPQNKRKAIQLEGNNDVGSSEKVEGHNGEWEDDLRVIVDYDVQILHHSLRDRLEWDLSSPLTPEAFAAQTCKDIGLSGEALPIIATALRENLLNHKRAVGEMGLIGLGELWGRAQAEEDEARKEVALEIQAAKRRKLAGLTPTGSTPLPGEVTPMPTAAVLDPSLSGTPSADAAPASTPGGQAAASLLPENGPSADAAQATPPRLPPKVRIAHALEAKADLVNRGPRLLLGAWRDWFDSKEFGPLLEYLPDAEIERREGEALRAIRRSRRDMARSGDGAGGGASRGGGINIREARFRNR